MTNQPNKKVLECLETPTVNTTVITADTGEGLKMVSTAGTVLIGTTNSEACPLRITNVRPWSKGSSAWVYMAVGIIIWDVLADEDEMLTYAFRRGSHTHRVLVCMAWGIVTGHLFEVIPSRVDPIHHTGMALRNAIRRRRNSA